MNCVRATVYNRSVVQMVQVIYRRQHEEKDENGDWLGVRQTGDYYTCTRIHARGEANGARGR